MSFLFTILGCGSSGGVPRIGRNGWGKCDSNNPRNIRRRCSLLVERTTSGGGLTSVLVDLSPDLRLQMLDASVEYIDAILITHAHADHIHGIDDVRPLVIENDVIDIFMDKSTTENVVSRFPYIFEMKFGCGYPPLLKAKQLNSGCEIHIDGSGGRVTALPFRLSHGDIDALGFRFGNVAYTPDVSGIPSESIECLVDLDVWIVDALKYSPHFSHFSLAETLDWIEKLKPKKAILTNLHTDMDYEFLKRQIPSNVEVAYDGMCMSSLVSDIKDNCQNS